MYDLVFQPLVKEHADYAPTIDRVHELGALYELAIRGETAEAGGRRRSSVSPAKRASLVSLAGSPSRKGSLDVRNASSGRMSVFGSRRTSEVQRSQMVQLDETSIIQDQLGEINSR